MNMCHFLKQYKKSRNTGRRDRDCIITQRNKSPLRDPSLTQKRSAQESVKETIFSKLKKSYFTALVTMDPLD